MPILDDAKLALRLSNTAYDIEILDLIDCAKADLGLSGLITIDETDTLIKRAILTYVKANFGWDNPDSERLMDSYLMLKSHLGLSPDYSYYTVTITASEQMKITFDGVTKETNDSGVVVFYSRIKNHVKYTANGIDYYVDITGNTEITVGG
jgi:hypothetical protein